MRRRVTMADQEYEQRVRHAAAFELPYGLTRAIWLVDVCGSSYASAATELGVSEPELARRVRRGRRAVRALAEERRTHAAPLTARSFGSALGSAGRWVSTIALAIIPLVAVAACGGEAGGDPIEVGHIHDIVERDGALLLGAHQGLLRLEGEELQRVGDEVHDLMSVAVLPGGDVVASGHPDMRVEKYRVEGAPSFLGLVRSADGGETWDVVDLLGQVDFHALAPADEVLYGGASSGMIWGFAIGGSAGHALGGVDQDLRDLAASPRATAS